MKRNRRLTPTEATTIRDVIVRLQSLPDYKPANTKYSIAALTVTGEAMDAAQDAILLAEQALSTARDNASEAEWAAYDRVRGVKAQVVAQYGDDSPAVQAVGLKKKSDYKRIVRRKAAA